MFQAKDKCKLKLQTSDTMKLFGSTKKNKKNKKNRKNKEWSKCTKSSRVWNNFGATKLSRQSISTKLSYTFIAPKLYAYMYAYLTCLMLNQAI